MYENCIVDFLLIICICHMCTINRQKVSQAQYDECHLQCLRWYIIPWVDPDGTPLSCTVVNSITGHKEYLCNKTN